MVLCFTAFDLGAAGVSTWGIGAKLIRGSMFTHDTPIVMENLGRTYQRITGFEIQSQIGGAVVNGTTIQVPDTANYEIHFTTSADGTLNLGVIHFHVEINRGGVDQESCGIDRTLTNTSIGAMALTCDLDLTSGDEVSMIVNASDATPSDDLNIRIANFSVSK